MHHNYTTNKTSKQKEREGQDFIQVNIKSIYGLLCFSTDTPPHVKKLLKHGNE